MKTFAQTLALNWHFNPFETYNTSYTVCVWHIVWHTF